MLTVGQNSYISLVESTEYTESQGLDLVADEQYLIRATKWIDRTFGFRFIAGRLNRAQTLCWPRYATADIDGNFIASETIPQAVKEATIEVALQMQAGIEMYVQPSPALTEETNQLDVIRTTKKYASPHLVKSVGDVDLYKIELILRPVLTSSTVNRLAR